MNRRTLQGNVMVSYCVRECSNSNKTTTKVLPTLSSVHFYRSPLLFTICFWIALFSFAIFFVLFFLHPTFLLFFFFFFSPLYCLYPVSGAMYSVVQSLNSVCVGLASSGWSCSFCCSCRESLFLCCYLPFSDQQIETKTASL